MTIGTNIVSTAYFLMIFHRIELSTTIVDLLNATDVTYGEVIVLSTGVAGENCTNVTLGFTDFEGIGYYFCCANTHKIHWFTIFTL